MKNQNDTNNEMNSETKRPLDRSKLGDLYPKAKTYDEIEERNVQAQLRQLARRPKHVALSVALGLSFFVVIIVFVTSNLQSFLHANVIAIPSAMMVVSSIFMLGLVAFGFIAWQAKRISNFFSEKGYNPWPFFAAYFMSVVPLLSGCYQLSVSELPAILTYMLLGVINMVLVYFLIAVSTAARLGNAKKVVVLAMTVILCIAVAVAATLV